MANPGPTFAPPAPAYFPPVPHGSGNHTARNLAVLAVLGVGGYFAYKKLYIPYAIKKDVLAKAAQLQAQNPGMTQQSALQQVAKMGCQAIGMYYGAPPQMTSGICNELAGVAQQLVQELPGITKNIDDAATNVAHTAMTIGEVPLNLVSSASNTLISIPENIAASSYRIAQGAVGVVTDTVSSIVDTTTHILSKALPWNW